MEERKLRIKGFRNIGIKEGENKDHELLINTSSPKKGVGEISFIVGPNNSGKSNVLDALLTYSGARNIDDDDLSDLYFEEAPKPELSFVYDFRPNASEKDENKRNDGRVKLTLKKTFGNKDVITTKSIWTKENGDKEAKIINRRLSEFNERLVATLLVYGNGKYISSSVTEPVKNFAIELADYLYRSNTQWFNRNPNAERQELRNKLQKIVETKSLPDDRVAVFTRVMEFFNESGFRSYLDDMTKYNAYVKPKLNVAHTTAKKYVEYLKENDTIIEFTIKPEQSIYKTLDVPKLTMFNYDQIDDLKKYIKGDKVSKTFEFLNEVDLNNFKVDCFSIVDTIKKQDSKFLDILDIKPSQLKSLIEDLKIPFDVEDLPEFDTYCTQFGVNLDPKIINFKEHTYKSKDLRIPVKDIKKSKFFMDLFKAIDFDLKNLENVYKRLSNNQANRGHINTLEEELNGKLKKISKDFNDLFVLSDDKNNKKYQFKVYLDTNEMSFSTSFNNIPLMLDKQSTGFKWFFNFYFTIINQDEINSGDIVVMDEPATNLHVLGIQELRKFIKDFAQHSGINFVISTHSPFFIDIDHLEELRVVNRFDKESIIHNMFHYIDHNDPDILKSIKEALTVSRYIFLNPKRKVIFVEGMTDYVYLTAFKRYHNEYKDLVFLPVNGLKKKDLLDRLIELDAKPTVLVDGDTMGESFSKLEENDKYKGIVTIMTLSSILGDGHDIIESVFHAADKPSNKKFATAVNIKNTMDYDKLQLKTKENFKKILRHVYDNC